MCVSRSLQEHFPTGPSQGLGGLLERPTVRDVVTHDLPHPLAARSPRVRGNQAKCLHPRRSAALARAATNAEHQQFEGPAGFRCCVTRTPRNRAERGDIGVFEGEAREKASLGSPEWPLFGTGVVTPYPRAKNAALCRTGRLLTRCATTAGAPAAPAARLVARTVVDPRTPSTTLDTSPPSVQDP